MKNLISKFKALSSETKAGIALALGTSVIIVAAFALSGGNNNTPITSSSNSEFVSEYIENNSSYISETPIVDVMQEEVIRPYVGEMDTIHYFYEKDAPVETRVKSIVKVPGETSTYIKSIGNDYAKADGTSFNVIASTSGEVVDKLVDATYGNVLIIEHKSSLRTIYASLGEMKVNKGETVSQGDVIATSGTSLYLQDYANGLHFEVLKDNKNLNPEAIYSKLVKEI